MKDPAQLAFIDQVLGQRDRGHAPVVIPNHVRHLGLLDGLDHLEPFGAIHGQRFFAKNHLAGLGGRERDLRMRIVRRADIDGVDVLAFDKLAPVGFDGLVAPGIGERLGLRRITRAHRLEHRPIFEIEEIIHPAIAIGMGTAHKTIADQANIQWFGHGEFLKRY